MSNQDRGHGYDVEAIKAANPLVDVLTARGVVMKRQGTTLKARCPFHKERHGESLAVYEQEGRWHCFGKCAAGGDVIRAVMLLDGLAFKEACERLGGKATGPLPPARPAPMKANAAEIAPLTKGELAMQAAAANVLADQARRYEGIAKRRGWQPETVRGLAQDRHLGTHGGQLAFLYPHGLKLRWQENDQRRIAWAFGRNNELWRMDRLELSGVERVYICEGETDCISLLDAGVEPDGTVAVVALPGASCWTQGWNALFSGRDVLVVTDADEAGEKAATRILDELSGTAARVVRVNPLALLPEDRREGAKDISDVHERLGNEGLRVVLESAATAALEMAAMPKQKPAKPEELPHWDEGSVDYADFAAEEMAQEEPFPLDCLPGVAGEMAREVARAAMVPEVLTGMNVLGLLSAAIGAGLEVNSGGDRRTRANLFLMPVAKSGTGKGQSFGAIEKPFKQREAERLAEWRLNDHPTACAQKVMAEARLAKLTADAKNKKELAGDDKKNLLAEIKQCQVEIDEAERNKREPVWITEEATKEGIEYTFDSCPRETLASFSSEARGAVDVLMGRYREATDESIFCKAYSGDATTIHRKASKSVSLNSPCLTVLWLLQPDKLRDLLESPAMCESGLMPRFLIADTRAEPQEEPEERHCVSEKVKVGWAALISTLLDEYHEKDGKAHVIQTEPAAASLMRDFYNEIVLRRKQGGDLADVDSYAARWAENAWRLCVVLHAATHGEDAWRENLSADTAARAVRLMRWFAEQQLRLLAAGREDKLAKRLEKLSGVLDNKPERQCNLSDLERRHAFGSDEVRRLAALFPSVLVVEKLSTGSNGRPPFVARLLPEAKAKRP